MSFGTRKLCPVSSRVQMQFETNAIRFLSRTFRSVEFQETDGSMRNGSSASVDPAILYQW